MTKLPDFFRALTHAWPGSVFVITYRDDPAKAREDIGRFGVRCDELILVNSFAEKAVRIKQLGISVYIDDQDEMLLDVPEGVTVLKIRNGGNYDYAQRKWLYSDRTGRRV